MHKYGVCDWGSSSERVIEGKLSPGYGANGVSVGLFLRLHRKDVSSQQSWDMLLQGMGYICLNFSIQTLEISV